MATNSVRLTPETLPKVIHQIAVRKRDLADPRIIESLKDLLDSSPNKLDPSRNKAVLITRQRILEQAQEIYLEAGEDELYFRALEESTMIDEILNLIKNE